MDNLTCFPDSGAGGAWPFLVGGVICLVDSDNERDLRLDFEENWPKSNSADT